MSAVEIVAGLAAAVCAAGLGLRANMLKPAFTSWYDAPTVVWLSMILLSITSAVMAIALFRGLQVSAPTMLFLVSAAVYSVTMLWNLARQSASRHGGPHPSEAPK